MIGANAAHFAQVAAAFAPSHAGKTALVSSTAPTARALFPHATAGRV
jgi:hypothetical protein